MLERAVPLVEQVKHYLIDRIAQDGFSEAGGRLPSEQQLSLGLNVSRSTVREALAVLARQGVVIRRHGIGTFINRNLRKLTSSITEVVEFNDLITEQGYKADVKLVHVHVEPAGLLATALGLKPLEQILVIDKVFLADGAPVIFCRNAIPWKLIPEEHRESVNTEAVCREPVYKILVERCREDVIYHVSRIRAEAADQRLADVLGCEKGHPLLCIDEVGYNHKQEPVLSCMEHYRDDLIHFQAVRGLVRPFSWEMPQNRSEV